MLVGVTVLPTVLQMVLLPFCPESPRFLYIIRSQEHHAKSGEDPVTTMYQDSLMASFACLLSLSLFLSG